MTTEGHIASLERRHRELDLRIENERNQLSHDDLLVSALKRKKLELKDELTRLQDRAA
ncbi:YdcH family protein [Devosia sp.]|uniref:YdcH family protein n=1 Tax=Devosia sp. TaxID=1871048 RepID=UPI003A9581B1